MSALSEYIKSQRESKYGTDQDVQNYIMQSNGSWYHNGLEDESAPAYDLAGIVGGSALSGVGDLATAAGVISKDVLDKYANYAGDTSAAKHDLSDWLINNGQYLTGKGADITARHMKQGKAPEGKAWGDMDFTDRATNADYWTDPYGVGADMAVMGGSLLSQVPLMAVTPELGITKAAGGLLGKLGGKLFTGAARDANKFTHAGNVASKAVKKAGHALKSNTAASMENWAVRTAPQTAMTNAGAIYGDLKEQGYTDSQIANNMYGMMAEEIPQDFVTGALTGLALSGKLGRIAGAKTRPRQFVQNFGVNVPLEAASEYYDEANQQRLQNKYSNKPYGEDLLNLLPDERAAGATAVAPSLVPGLAGGARNVITRGRSLREAYNDWRRDRAIQTLNTQIQATNNAITGTSDNSTTPGGGGMDNVSQTIDDTNQVLAQSVDDANSNIGVPVQPTTTTSNPQPTNTQQPARQSTGNDIFGAGAADIATQGADIDDQVAGLKDGWQSVIPQIAGVIQNQFGITGAQISSGFRNKEHNAEVGGAENSYHVGDGSRGDALDIVLPDNTTPEQAEAIRAKFENSGAFKEVLFHDSGSGYHLHLGGLNLSESSTNSATNGGSYSGNTDIDNAINAAANKYGVDPALLAAIAEQESNFYQGANSGAGAIGIMQLMPDTARGLGVDPNDLHGNIEGGAKYLRQMLDAYNGDTEKALAAYNAGPGALDGVNGDISQLSSETQNYVPSVMKRYAKFKGSIAAPSNNAPINADMVFDGVEDDFTNSILTDFAISAMEDEDYSYPNIEAFVQRGIENDKYTKEDAQDVLDNGAAQFIAYLESELAESDNKLAQKMAEFAATAKDLEGMSRIQNALNTNDTPVIKQVATKYRKQVEGLLSNIRYADTEPVNTQRTVSTEAPRQNTSQQPPQQHTTAPTNVQQANTAPRANNTPVNNTPANQPKPAQPQAGPTQTQNAPPTASQAVSNNTPAEASNNTAIDTRQAEQRKQAEEVQDLWSRQSSNMAHIQAMAMDDIPQSRPQRVQQAQAIQQVAAANDVQLPKAIQPGLEAGATKAIKKAQELIAPSLEEVKEENTNESTKSTESSQATTTEGINTENQVQHTKPEQVEAPAEVTDHNPAIETGTHINTRSGKEQYKAVIHEKLDWKRLKELAKKHHGGYSRFVKAYLFNNEADRNAFAADVDKEFFANGKKNEAKADPTPANEPRPKKEANTEAASNEPRDDKNADVKNKDSQSYHESLTDERGAKKGTAKNSKEGRQGQTQEEQIRNISDALGVDAKYLSDLLKTNPTEDNKNARALHDMTDFMRAAAYFTAVDGETPKQADVGMKSYYLLKQFILNGGMDIMPASEVRKNNWLAIHFPSEIKDTPRTRQEAEWHRLYKELWHCALQIKSAKTTDGLPNMDVLRAQYDRYQRKSGSVIDARLDSKVKRYYDMVVEAEKDQRAELEGAIGEENTNIKDNQSSAKEAEPTNTVDEAKATENTTQPEDAAEESSIFGEYDEDELFSVLGITAVDNEDASLSAPDNISNTAEERERLEKELAAELSKISANPVFNPRIYSLGLQLGFTYIKDGYNTAKKWLAKMHQQFGDNITPWAPAILKTIQDWPAGEPFNEKIATYITKNVGALYESGEHNSLNAITHTITQRMSAKDKKRFAPVIEAAYNGIKVFFDNMEEVKNNGQKQSESRSTAGGREGVQSRTAERAEETESEATSIPREVPGRSGRENVPDTRSAAGEDSRESGIHGEGTGRRKVLDDSTGDSKRGDKQSAAVNSEPAKTVIANQPAGNYEIKEAAAGKKNKEERYKQNIETVKLLKQLEAENRMPTAAEQDVLAAYNGWGGLKNSFLDGEKDSELKELLTAEEYESAKSTINDAFFTSPDDVKTIWEGVSHLGFKGGRVLDPSMGIGNFFGCMPRDIMAKSTLHGIELDDLTARIAKKLYPNAFVEHKGFQNSKSPDNYYDLVISNIPFGTTKVQGYNIHNFFFANGMDKVRPGGLMVFITSQGTLTNGSDGARMRSYLSEQADMIAAYKLPEGTFKDAGTDVVTDVIIMQKRGEDGKPSPHAQKFTQVESFSKDRAININSYFEAHPENILGETYAKYTNRGRSVGVKPESNTTTAEALAKAMESLPADIYTDTNRKKSKVFDTTQAASTVAAEEGTRDYEYYEKDGKLYQRTGDGAQEVTNGATGANKKKVETIKGILKVKGAMKKLIAAQYDPKLKEADLDKLRKELNKIYDEFVKKYGYLNSETPKRFFKEDPSAGMLLALERPQYETVKTTSKNGKTTTTKKLVGVEKTAIFSKRIIDPIEEVTKAESPADALLYSLNNQGVVDLEYMAKLLNSTPEKVAGALKGQVYKNPATGRYETKDEYLSGNVRQKLAVAELESKNDKAYQENVEALKKVVPEDLVSDEILVNMGSPWIPETDIQDYCNYLTRERGNIKVTYSHAAAKWEVTGYEGPSSRFSSKGISLAKLLTCILNNKAIEIYDKYHNESVLNREATDAANVVADDIRNDFREWIWQDKEREGRLVRYYNDNYNNSVNRGYDGSHLTFPGKNPAIRLDPHQKNVVWRMLQNGNTLIAHCVGAGKTFSMQAAGMEMRRLGIARKPMYCLPNNVVEQFTREFRLLYPNAKILMLTNDDLPAVPQSKTTKKSDGRTAKKTLPMDATFREKVLAKRAERTRTLSRIQTEDWDAIVISHNLFERFPVSPETAAGFVRAEIQNVENAIMETKGSSFNSRDLSNLENRKKSLEEKLDGLLNTDISDIGIPFEELGIDQLFVDEADLFKNLAYASTMDRISGLANSNANRSTDMFMKTQWLTQNMGGRGVVFATGTPISNTMAEMYTMMRYMDMQGLKEKGLDLFDRWCATFAEIGAGIERKPTGDGFRKVNKVKRFINMADLVTMFRKFADVKTQDDLNLDIPELKNGKPTIVTLKPDPTLVDYIKNVVPRRVANMKRSFKQEKGADNMLALTNDLRKMSLNDAKIEACADMIAKKFEETTDVKGAQLVFCDQGIPRADKGSNAKEGAKKGEADNEVLDDESEQDNESVYTKLMEVLKRRGIPEKQIAFVQSAKTKPQMDAMFQRVDSGDLRILIGSTQKMGAGTNCQHHLVALHDLDAPWRPRDLEQRHGRILRRGNENKEVEIFNYVVQDSFDANMWEKLKNKAAIIAQAMSGNTQLRAVEDADLVTLGYAEIEGAATGNPLIKEQLKLNNEVTKYANAQKTFKKQQAAAQQVVENRPRTIENLKTLIGKIQEDVANKTDTKGDKFRAVIGGKVYTERTKAEAALKKITDAFTKKTSTEIGEIGGMKIKALYNDALYMVGDEESSAKGSVSLQLVGNVAYSVKTPSVQGIENTLHNQLDVRLKKANEDLQAAEDELTAAKEQLKKTYPHAEKLKEMQKRLNEINREIEKNLVEGGQKQEEAEGASDEAGNSTSNSNSQETANTQLAARENVTAQGATYGENSNDDTDDDYEPVAFSVAENDGNSSMTTEEFEAAVHAAFPGAKNFQSDRGTVTFELPNSSKVTVNLVDNIAFSEEARKRAAKDYGRAIGENESVEGSYHSVGRDGFITLAKGGRVGTIFHEAYHMAKNTVLNAKEKDFLSKRYENEEEEAEAYREWRLARDRQGMFGKIWRKIKDFAENMANVLGIETKGHIFRGIESGESFKRGANKESVSKKKNFSIGRIKNSLKEIDRKYMSLVSRYVNGDLFEDSESILNKIRDMVQQAAEKAGYTNAIPEQVRAYKVRTKAAPKKTLKVYKVFTVDENGRPSALFVSSKDALPQNVWLDAQDTYHFPVKNSEGKVSYYVPSTKNPNSQGNATGTSVTIQDQKTLDELKKMGYVSANAKVGSKITALAYRPGWHAGTLPFFPQGGMKVKNPDYTGKGDYEHAQYADTPYPNIHRYNQVVFECELAFDHDYNAEAQATHDGDLEYMPTDGAYYYATNPLTRANPELGAWAISGSLKIGRALTQEECDKILAEHGMSAQQWEGGSLRKGTEAERQAAIDNYFEEQYADVDDKGKHKKPQFKDRETYQEWYDEQFPKAMQKKQELAERGFWYRRDAKGNILTNKNTGEPETSTGKVSVPRAINAMASGYGYVSGKLDLAKLGYTGEEFDAARKTLAPITYDDNGRVIPLSKRFDPSVDDVRYSIAPANSNSNTKQGLIQRLKNKFWNGNSNRADTYRQQAKAMLQDLTQAKISWGKLDDDTKVLYKELQGIIRVGKPYDWGSMMPTAGGIVAKRLGITESEEMNNYIADWILTGAIGNNSEEATEFAKAMKQNAYMSDKLLDVQNLFMQHSDQITHDFHQNVVSFEQPREKTGAKQWLDDFYDNWIEELGPVKRMVEAIEKTRKSKLPVGVNPYTWFRLLRGHYGKAITMVEGNSQKAVTALQQLYPSVDFTSFKTLNMIMRDIGATGDKAKRKAFSEYCVAKHLLDIHRRNSRIQAQQNWHDDEIARLQSEIAEKKLKNPGMTDSDYRIRKIQDVIDGHEGAKKQLEKDIMATPMPEKKCQEIIDNAPNEFIEAQQDIVHYSNTLMGLLYDSGVIGKKRYLRTLDKWPNYVPMFRVFEENEEVQFGDSLKAQTGSGRQVIDPMESLVKNTFDFVKRAERNKCKLMVANLARCSGVGEYIDVTNVKGNPDLRDTVSFYIDGHKRYLATDPAVVKAINGMDRDNSGTLLKILQWPVKLGRACFVLVNPAFAVRNIFRDGADATIYAKYGFTPKDMLNGLLHAIRKDGVYYEWLASGAAQASAISVDRKYAQSTLDNMTMSTKEKLLTPRKWLDILQAAGEYSEYATRIGAYQRTKAGAMAKGMTANGAILEAAMESRDLMDFARGGRKSRALNKVSLFANAAIQGWDKFFRAFDPRDKKSFMRAAARLAFTAILPSLTLAMLFRGDDWWEELPEWMKENNWVMKIGDTIIRIPKGQDVGIRFFTNFVEKAVGQNSKVSATKALKPLYEALPSIAPFALMPIFEAMADHSFFTDGPVVPGYLSKLPADKQYNTSTSMLSRLVGETTGISPMKIDHVLYGYTGNVSRGANELINWLGKDKKSMPNLTDLPVINGITYMPYKNPASVTEFYSKWDKMQQEHALYNQTGEARNGYSEAEYKRMKKASDKMSELAKKERAIVSNEKLTNAEQYARQMKIQQQRMKIAEAFRK